MGTYLQAGSFALASVLIAVWLVLKIVTRKSKADKIGLSLLVVNSVLVLFFCFVDTINALEVGSSGFALIPIMMIDFPSSLLALILSTPFGWVNFLLEMRFANNDHFWILLDTLIHHSGFTLAFAFAGGLQWYGIGLLISRMKKSSFKQVLTNKFVLILLAIIAFAVYRQYVGTEQSHKLLPYSEVVLKPGTSVTATNANGTVTIEAGEGTERTFKGQGWTQTKKLVARRERWIRSLGLYSPSGNVMADEGRLHFASTSEALRYLYVGSDFYKPVYTNNGLVFGYFFDASGWPTMRHIELYQIYINGKRPTAIPGADDSALSVSGGSIMDESTPYPAPSGPAEFDGLGKEEYHPKKT